ncbi:hypothetical protein [Nocardia sp. NPDC020380]|uniref:hypothetical protein n=1 Tax=unclassified Nocardia TaxID=2637762 RepID=UPI0037AB58F9
MAFFNFNRTPMTVLSVLGGRNTLTEQERANLRATRPRGAVYTASLGGHARIA